MKVIQGVAQERGGKCDRKYKNFHWMVFECSASISKIPLLMGFSSSSLSYFPIGKLMISKSVFIN